MKKSFNTKADRLPKNGRAGLFSARAVKTWAPGEAQIDEAHQLIRQFDGYLSGGDTESRPLAVVFKSSTGLVMVGRGGNLLSTEQRDLNFLLAHGRTPQTRPKRDLPPKP
jgi:hypothetical protein